VHMPAWQQNGASVFGRTSAAQFIVQSCRIVFCVLWSLQWSSQKKMGEQQVSSKHLQCALQQRDTSSVILVCGRSWLLQCFLQLLAVCCCSIRADVGTICPQLDVHWLYGCLSSFFIRFTGAS
jgi:hypothetical protein